MALRDSMRRDQRRRLLTSRSRDDTGEADSAAVAGDPVAATSYDDAAHPERHPALATRLPVGAGRFLAVALAILLAFAGSIVVAVSGPLFGRPLVSGGGRFASTLAVVAGAFDPRGVMPFQVWLAELAVLAAAAVAGAVRFMRRHRRDDYKGRFRAWGWLAVLLTITAWAGAVPLGQLVAAAVSEGTGIALGPDGIGWWIGLAAMSYAIVVPWAVLPLRERGATLFWIVLALVAWTVAAAMPWAGVWLGDSARGAIVAQSAWVAGAGLMLIAMLAAARSVIREVRGQCVARPARPARSKRRAKAVVATEGPSRVEGGSGETDDDDASNAAEEGWNMGHDEDSGGESHEPSEAEFVDGSEDGHRRLSKAERKRLRKMARMNGTAA